MLDRRERNLFISLLEEAYEEKNYTCFADAIWKESELFKIENESVLFDKLRRKYGKPGGAMSRVVTKKVFEYTEREEMTVFDLLYSFDAQPNEISDDKLVRHCEK